MQTVCACKATMREAVMASCIFNAAGSGVYKIRRFFGFLTAFIHIRFLLFLSNAGLYRRFLLYAKTPAAVKMLRKSFSLRVKAALAARVFIYKIFCCGKRAFLKAAAQWLRLKIYPAFFRQSLFYLAPLSRICRNTFFIRRLLLLYKYSIMLPYLFSALFLC